MVSLAAQNAAAPPSLEDAHRAFTTVYRQQVNAVYRYILVRVGSHDDAQDITAQTFTSALANFHAYRGEGETAAWLLGIARHKVADHFRSLGRRTVVPLNEEITLPDHIPEPDETVALRLQVERVTAALDALAPDRAEALRLHLFGGLTSKEAAAVMRKTESAVKMLISRGLADLRTRLNPDMQEGS